MPTMNYSAASDTGLVRSNNEDSYLSLAEDGLWIIADGMGGHDAGEVASAIVVDTLRDEIRAGATLQQAIQCAHAAVLAAVARGDGASGMGSTVIALKSIDKDYEIAWVGDSRAYLWTPDDFDGGQLQQLSTDHSYVQMLLNTGVIEEKEVANHPDKNIITQCVGSQDISEISVDSIKGEWEENQWILLCSDGLTDELTDEVIAQDLANARTVRDATGRLMRQALTKGGRDNITLQVIESPLSQKDKFALLQEWLPSLTGNRTVDNSLYIITGLCLLFLLFWIVN